MNRRQFVRYGALAAAGTAVRVRGVHASPRAVVRVGLLLPAEASAVSASAERGVRFGAGEAARTAALLGGELTLVTDSTEVDAYVRIDGAATVPSGSLVVDLFGDACTDLRLSIPRSATNAARARAPDAALVRWHGTLERYGAAQLNDRYRAAHGAPMDDAAWAGWFAVKVLWEAAARVSSVTAQSLRTFLLSERALFDGHKGEPLRFSARGLLEQPLYLVRDDAAQQVALGELMRDGDPCES